jgi:hypothetical protein
MKITLGQLRLLIKEGIDNALQTLKELPSLSTSDFIKNPIPMYSGRLSKILQSLGIKQGAFERALGRKKLPTQIVSLTSLLTIQGWVSRLGVEKALLNQRDWDPTGLPTIVELPDGALVITDGNHRLVAALMKGDHEANVRVLKLTSLIKENVRSNLITEAITPNFFHISTVNLGKKTTLTPRIPRFALDMKEEDFTTPRVCLARSFKKALGAVGFWDDYDETTTEPDDDKRHLYVYGTNVVPGLFVPNSGEYPPGAFEGSDEQRAEVLKGFVPDADHSGEVWSLKPITLKLISEYVFDEKLRKFRKIKT